MLRKQIGWLASLLGVLALAGAVQAQQRIGGGTGGTGSSSSSSGGFTGSSSGGFTGSSSGGFTGSSSGGFTGTGTGSGTGGFSGQSGQSGQSGLSGRTGTGTTAYGQSSFMGRYYGSPLAAGLATGRTTGASGTGSQYLRQFPVTLSFGQPLYDQAAVSRSPQLGTTTGLGGLGTGSQLGTGRAALGGSSAGIRRAPQYLTQLASTIDETSLPRATPPVTQTAVLSEVRAVIGNATRLPSRDNISVTTTNDGVIVLRGQVASERERRMAEALIRLSPGVREVRNELTRPQR